MKKDKRRASTKSSLKSRTNGSEDFSRLTGEFAPGRKGGRYEFPFGGYMTVDSGVVNNKKGVVSCCMVSPSDRHEYAFELKPYEVLVSEFFLMRLNFTNRSLKKPIHLRLPTNLYDEPNGNNDIVVNQRDIEGQEWTETEFTTASSAVDGQQFVELMASRSVVFVATSRPKTEQFDVPVQGCLHNSHLSKQISLRFPKKATDMCITCEIQIVTLDRANLVNLAREYPHDINDLLAATDYINITTSVDQPFRRAVTVKLPLPTMEDENFPQDDIVVMILVGTTWQLMETPIKFTKSAITFDTRTLGRYCVVLCRPQRRKRMKETFRHIRDDERVVRGEILVFVHTEAELWNLWVHAVPHDQASALIDQRELQGFRQIAKSFTAQPEVADTSTSFSRRTSWRVRRTATASSMIVPKVDRTDIDLMSERVIELQLSGDICVSSEDPGRQYMGLRFDERLPQNYRHFVVEPTSTDACHPLTAQLRCYMSGADGVTCVRTFDIDFELEAVKAYLHTEEEVEQSIQESTSAVLLTEQARKTANDSASGDAIHVSEKRPKKTPEQQKQPPCPQRDFTPSKDSTKVSANRSRALAFARLTKPMKPPREAIRESKVLTGRSLACLAREVEQGLTLAIYLGISDSTITGMGFDALANGQSIVDITYRILLLWKRRTNIYKNKQVDLLADALNDMGRSDLVAVLMDHHRQNIELSPDCFVAGL
ncbi:hypothetical protein LSAT2_014760 [Lamellibrachia satsuma]|nr:hypothetical protein LSAT2_014760 [Lamellibrachia satsuma]